MLWRLDLQNKIIFFAKSLEMVQVRCRNCIQLRVVLCYYNRLKNFQYILAQFCDKFFYNVKIMSVGAPRLFIFDRWYLSVDFFLYEIVQNMDENHVWVKKQVKIVEWQILLMLFRAESVFKKLQSGSVLAYYQQNFTKYSRLPTFSQKYNDEGAERPSWPDE